MADIQQAEDLLRPAMERDPRLALKHKLLSRSTTPRKCRTFGALARENGRCRAIRWTRMPGPRALDMGRELSPTTRCLPRRPVGVAPNWPGLAAAAAAGAAAKAVDDDTLSLDDLELSELTAAYDEDNTGSDDLERHRRKSRSCSISTRRPA